MVDLSAMFGCRSVSPIRDAEDADSRCSKGENGQVDMTGDGPITVLLEKVDLEEEKFGLVVAFKIDFEEERCNLFRHSDVANIRVRRRQRTCHVRPILGPGDVKANLTKRGGPSSIMLGLSFMARGAATGELLPVRRKGIAALGPHALASTANWTFTGAS
jgi:hypothetical protein